MAQDKTNMITEVTKGVPPISVSFSTFLGFELQEWLYIVTIVYTLAQLSILGHRLYKKLRSRFEDKQE